MVGFVFMHFSKLRLKRVPVPLRASHSFTGKDPDSDSLLTLLSPSFAFCISSNPISYSFTSCSGQRRRGNGHHCKFLHEEKEGVNNFFDAWDSAGDPDAEDYHRTIDKVSSSYERRSCFLPEVCRDGWGRGLCCVAPQTPSPCPSVRPLLLEEEKTPLSSPEGTANAHLMLKSTLIQRRHP